MLLRQNSAVCVVDEVFPFFREYVARSQVGDISNNFLVQPIVSCPQILSGSSELSLREATALCCGKEVTDNVQTNNKTI